jgi:hypothetical protein
MGPEGPRLPATLVVDENGIPHHAAQDALNPN